MENVWTFEFVDETSQNNLIENGIVDEIGSGASEKPDKKKKKDKGFDEAFSNKISDDLIKQYAISPLNTVTGGLASPIYRTATRISNGTSVGVALGSFAGVLGMMAVNFAISSIEKRMQNLEQKVQNLNNADNALIRAGAVSKTTYYSANIFGIKKKTNRS